MSWVFRRWGICAVVSVNRGTAEWFGSKGALMIICSFPEFPLHCSAAEAAPLPFFLESDSIASSLSLSRFFLVLFQSFPCSAEPGCSVTPGQARLGHCHHLSCSIIPFLWGLLRAPGLRGLLPVLLWSSCSQLTKSTWTAVARRGVDKCIHKVWDLCRRERSRCMAIALWEPSALKPRETNPRTSPTSRFWLGEESRCCGVVNENDSFSQPHVPVHWDEDCSGTGIVCDGTASVCGQRIFT